MANSSETTKQATRGVVAEYDAPDALIAAANRVREAGYTKTDAFSPFPVHGIDEAIGIRPTILPWIVLAAGITGCLTGASMQIWMNAHEYPYIISGKPYISLPAFVPVAFELTILFSAFAAFFGQWALNGLPRFSNPLFTSPKFDAATDDKFFLYIDSRDKRFDEAGAKDLLNDTSPLSVEEVLDDPSSESLPKVIYLAVIVLMVASIFPLLVIGTMRVTKSESPRFHIFWDMDFMPSKGPQETTIMFSDGRTMRPNVPGTVRRGEVDLDVDYQTGVKLEELAKIDPVRATRLVNLVRGSLLDEADEQDAEAGDGKEPAEAKDDVEDEAGSKNEIAEKEAPKKESADSTSEEVDNTPWVTDNPLSITSETIAHGRARFEIYCAVCHGRDGFGDGLVNQRAKRILATTWTQPSSLHDERLQEEKMPDGKIFNTITNGVRKMPGYAGQIPVQDRWAIIAYLRALQSSRNATIDQIPADQKNRLKKRAAKEKKAIEAKEAARLKKEAEKKKKQEEAKAKKSDKAKAE